MTDENLTTVRSKTPPHFDDTRSLLIHALNEQENDRPRTKQKMLGPSSLGSCQRQTVYKLLDTEPKNNTSRIAAMMGTAIHGMIESALIKQGYEHTEITVPGIEGLLANAHIDFYLPAQRKIVDWKSTKKSNLRYFPYPSQVWQVQTYGYLAVRAGKEVETVELVAIPRDGTEQDIAIHSEPYDETVAQEAIDWLVQRYNEAAVGYLPEPEKYSTFCRLYCEFYSDEPGYCQGKKSRGK